MQLATNAIEMAQLVLRRVLPEARILVDATAGNGNDTLFLAENSPQEAKIYAFDIQPRAIADTEKRTAAYKDRIQYVLDSHERLGTVVHEPIDAIIFNLGYLPGGDHHVTTDAMSTLAAVQAAVEKLALHGVLVVVVYPGHPAGQAESEALAEYMPALPCGTFTVGCYRMVNHEEGAPFLYIVEKVRG